MKLEDCILCLKYITFVELKFKSTIFTPGIIIRKYIKIVIYINWKIKNIKKLIKLYYVT